MQTHEMLKPRKFVLATSQWRAGGAEGNSAPGIKPGGIREVVTINFL